jgi:hypothetical protein
MMLLSQTPATLLAFALFAMALLAFVSGVLGWHGLRRAFGVPRVPRPRAMYCALALAWGLLLTASAATAMSALLLRDHDRLDGPTEIGEVACEPTTEGHSRVEIRTVGGARLGNPERYEVVGDSCTLSVKEIDFRPGLRPLGLRALARVDEVGSVVRPTANPIWLTPTAAARSRVLGLVVEQTRAFRMTVPAGVNQRFVVVATPGQEPALQRAPI